MAIKIRALKRIFYLCRMTDAELIAYFEASRQFKFPTRTQTLSTSC
jgi:hypothetical protein